MSEAYTGMGTLSNGKTVVLDKPVHLPPGRVRVIVEALPVGPTADDWLTTLKAIRQSLQGSGHRPRTRDEIDAQIESERESWEC